MSARRAITVQPLHCPLPSTMSPHAAAVRQWLTDWLGAHGPATDAAARRRIDHTDVARYAARLYPDATELRLRAVSGLFTWFFLLDDAADGTATPDPDRVRGLIADALAVVRADSPPAGAPPPGSPPGGSPSPDSPPAGRHLHALLADAWRTPRSLMPAPWRERFLDALRHHLGGVLGEARAKAAGRHPSVEHYVRLRRATSAAYVAHTLTEFAARTPLPDAIARHPAVRAYSTAGNDLLSWFNDLLSLDRDEVTAGGHNLVLALAAELRLSVTDAIEVAVARWRRRMAEFPALRAAVPSFGPAWDPRVRRYLDGVDHSVRGTIDWSLETIRYRPPDRVAAYL